MKFEVWRAGANMDREEEGGEGFISADCRKGRQTSDYGER